MMRIITPVSTLITVIFIAVTVVFMSKASEDHSGESVALINTYLSGSSGDYDPSGSDFDMYHARLEEDTRTAATAVFVFLAFLNAGFVLSLMKIKTKTVKVLSIIGICLTSLATIFNFVPISSPGGASFDEVGILFLLFGVIALSFFIVATVHAFRKKNQPAMIQGVAV